MTSSSSPPSPKLFHQMRRCESMPNALPIPDEHGLSATSMPLSRDRADPPNPAESLHRFRQRNSHPSPKPCRYLCVPEAVLRPRSGPAPSQKTRLRRRTEVAHLDCQTLARDCPSPKAHRSSCRRRRLSGNSLRFDAAGRHHGSIRWHFLPRTRRIQPVCR